MSRIANRKRGNLAWRGVVAGMVLWTSAALGGEAQPAGAGGNPDRLEREGVVVEFSVVPVAGQGGGRTELREGEYADVAFRLTDAAKGEPLRMLRPGAWMDMGKVLEGKGGETLTCGDKIGLYLRGIVGIRPMLDLNGFFVMVLNRDPSISVIDPLVGMIGRTNLYASIPLKKPGADWVKSADEKRFYVTLPEAGEIAVVDAHTFKVAGYADAGENPVRAALQPDGAYLWVGNDGKGGGEGGVTAIDTGSLAVAARIPTGRGHHEIAFSSDSRYAFVGNGRDGTVSVIDIQARKKIRDVKTGAIVLSLDYSPLSRALYVPDGKEGGIAVVDGATFEVAARIAAKPGLGAIRFTPDGRWGFVVNSREDAVHVIDSSTNRLAYTLPVGKEPYQISLTRSFAHIRCLGSERVSMINILELGKEAPPPVNSYPAGESPPSAGGPLGISQTLSPGGGEAEMIVADPANDTIYYYMEGMNAPMANFPGYGHSPRGVAVTNRNLRETEPGVYTTRILIPTAGVYDVAFFLDSPRIVHCFRATANVNPGMMHAPAKFEIEYLIGDRTVRVGEKVPFRFRLIDPKDSRRREGLKDVAVMYYATPGARRTRVKAQEVEQGVYEAVLSISRAGAYYVYVAAPSVNLTFEDMRFITLVGVAEKAPPREGEKRNGR